MKKKMMTPGRYLRLSGFVALLWTIQKSFNFILPKERVEGN